MIPNAPGKRPAKPVRSSRKLDSAARPPTAWVPAAMHNRQDNDLVIDRTEVRAVRSCVVLHTRVGQRILKDQRDCCLYRGGEEGAETDTFFLVPSSSIKVIPPRPRVEIQGGESPTARELPAHLFPRDAAARIREMVLDPSVELCLLLRRQSKLPARVLGSMADPPMSAPSPQPSRWV